MTLRGIDWSQVLGEIAYLLGDEIPGSPMRTPLGTERLARELGISRGAVRSILDGAEPRHSEGERYLERWSALAGKAPALAPRLDPAG